MLKEFREFALKGNVVDLAVGVIIGAAFGKIVDSMVNDIIMPVIGAITGGIDFSNIFFMLTGTRPASANLEDARKAGAVFAYGNFITVVVNFAIIAAVLFLVVKGINRLRRRQSEAAEKTGAPVPIPADVQVLTEIRDLLRTRA